MFRQTPCPISALLSGWRHILCPCSARLAWNPSRPVVLVCNNKYQLVPIVEMPTVWPEASRCWWENALIRTLDPPEFAWLVLVLVLGTELMEEFLGPWTPMVSQGGWEVLMMKNNKKQKWTDEWLGGLQCIAKHIFCCRTNFFTTSVFLFAVAIICIVGFTRIGRCFNKPRKVEIICWISVKNCARFKIPLIVHWPLRLRLDTLF